MSVYLLETEVNLAGSTAVSSADSTVVVAHSVEDARAVAKAQYTGVSGAAWDKAKVTELLHPEDAHGFKFVVAVSLEGETVAEVVCEGADGDSLDDLGVKVAKALNDLDSIHGAAYNADEHVLTVASALGGDNLGDGTVFAAVYPPGVQSPGAPGIPGCVKGIIHQNEPSDTLQVVLPGSAYSLPCKVVAFGHSS